MTGVRFFVRAEVEERRIVTPVTFFPGAPPDGAAADVVRFDLAEVVGVGDHDS